MRYTVDKLSFDYMNKTVLTDIELDVPEGKMIGIIGPNGCGKTTLLKNLNKNLSPKSGRVLVDDQDIAGMSKKEIARSIAAVPQGNEIRFAFTVRDIVSMGRMPFQRQLEGESNTDREIIDMALRETNLYEMRDKYITELSGGERQRAIIARSLAQTPKVLLMDEPTNHLDINMQFEVLDLVKRLSVEKGLTVIIVSHDLSMAARYCDKIAMIHDHRIMCYGPPEDVLTHENIALVFNIDADLTRDEKSGQLTVCLHGVIRH